MSVDRHEAVIGLEVHAQLVTATKIFCPCATSFGEAPNSRTCPVCLGYPGALPVLNSAAVEAAVGAARARGCDRRARSSFARKHYFYPDLPKGYQISQYDSPLAEGGGVTIESAAGERTIPLIRLHLEEDAGKLIHDESGDSLVDLNRAGAPLAEIVSQPEIRSPAEAHAYLERLRSILRYTGVCDGNMERGSLRCDANVSVRPRGSRELGTRTEVKNLNSFRNVKRALEYEIRRQVDLVEAGAAVVQQTLLWDAGEGRTRPMRGKEEAHDYRYLPDPDLPGLVLEPEWIERLRRDLPELPGPRRARFITELGVGWHEAGLLTVERRLADYFEAVVQGGAPPPAAANWVLNDILRARNETDRGDDEIPLPARYLAELIALVADGTISATVARQEIFPAIHERPRPPADVVRERGLEQLSDDSRLERWVRQVVDEHAGAVARYRAGKQGLLGFFVGKVMDASGGKANPGRVAELLRRELDGRP